MSLDPNLVLAAYSQGLFPMADDDGEVGWYRPDPRAVLPLDRFHCPRSLARTVRAGRFDVSFNRSCAEVIRACAAPAPGRDQTWINDDIRDAFLVLHHHGYVHSVECRQDGELAGGLYGLAVGGLFAGESMFSRRTDASKVALVHLVHRMKRQGMTLLDVQFTTAHLRRFGVVEIDADTYERHLADALRQPVSFDKDESVDKESIEEEG